MRVCVTCLWNRDDDNWWCKESKLQWLSDTTNNILYFTVVVSFLRKASTPPSGQAHSTWLYSYHFGSTLNRIVSIGCCQLNHSIHELKMILYQNSFFTAFLFFSFCLPSSSFSQLTVTSARRTIRSGSSIYAESESNTRRNLLTFSLPLTVALIANAPFIAVMANPPTVEERETMLTEWCKGETCTLLGGGAGYFDGATSIVEGVYDSNLKMPSVEEYEEQARIAAELASKD